LLNSKHNRSEEEDRLTELVVGCNESIARVQSHLDPQLCKVNGEIDVEEQKVKQRKVELEEVIMLKNLG
jgi:hypothetical protein